MNKFPDFLLDGLAQSTHRKIMSRNCSFEKWIERAEYFFANEAQNSNQEHDDFNWAWDSLTMDALIFSLLYGRLELIRWMKRSPCAITQ